MIHRGDLNLACVVIFDRVVGTVVTVVHFDGLRAKGEGQHLVTQADTEDWNVSFENAFDHWHGVFAGCSRIARAV